MNDIQQEHNAMVTQLAKDGAAILETLTPAKCHLWHMVTGVIGESIEAKFFECPENLLEELGDLEFYLVAIREVYAVSYVYLPKADPRKLTEVLDDVVKFSGDLIDNMKKELIYNKKDKTSDIVTAIVALDVAMAETYQVSGISRDDALAHNLNKLLKGKNARYSSGDYSDKQAQERSDKGGEE